MTNQKNTMHHFAIQLIKKFFTDNIHLSGEVLPLQNEIKLFKLYDIYDNKSQCNQLLLLWCDIEGINCCVNDTATCESCKKDLEQYWKCCGTCPNAICHDCQNCQDCQEYIDSFGIDC